MEEETDRRPTTSVPFATRLTSSSIPPLLRSSVPTFPSYREALTATRFAPAYGV